MYAAKLVYFTAITMLPRGRTPTNGGSICRDWYGWPRNGHVDGYAEFIKY